MLSKGPAKKVTIFINEDTQHHMTALHDSIMSFLMHKGVYGATAPMLVTGLIYLSGSVLDFDWTVFGLGAWLIAAAAISSFAGPRTVWAAAGLAATAGFWAAAVLARRRRS